MADSQRNNDGKGRRPGQSPSSRGASSGRASSGGRPSGGRPSGPGERGGARSGGPRRDGAPARGEGRPSRGGERSDRRGFAESGERSDRPAGRGGKPAAGGGKNYGPRGEGKGGPARGARPQREPRPERTASQAEYDGPDLPAEITGAELDRGVAAALKGLPEKLASRVARHLVAAGSVIDEDPDLAYRHTLAAKARAARIAVVREAVGETAYAAGKYAEALAELRAAKRMNGSTAYLPVMADCHRALGHPEQAIKLAKSPSVANFPTEAKAEMTIVEAGARRDMGQFDAALRVLELAPLMSRSREEWVVRLRYAYADTLEAAGRLTDALTWFHRAHAIDADQTTDAEERAAVLEKRVEQQG